MTEYSIPSTVLSLSEDGALVKITKDVRQPFGSMEILLNEVGLERCSGLIDDHKCNGLFLYSTDRSSKESRKYFRPNLSKINHPEAITALCIDGEGKFAPDFDFDPFKRFENVKSLTLGEISVIKKMTTFFPKLEVLRIFGWAKNKVQCQEGLWPHLRCLHIVGFRGDLSIFANWNLQVLFLHYSRLEPFSSLCSFPHLQTFAAEALNSDVDLALLSDLARLKHLSVVMPRQPTKMSGFTSKSLERMTLDKVDPAYGGEFDARRDFPSLKIYRIDMGRNRVLERWDGFRQYGDPFASVSFIKPYPPE